MTPSTDHDHDRTAAQIQKAERYLKKIAKSLAREGILYLYKDHNTGRLYSSAYEHVHEPFITVYNSDPHDQKIGKVLAAMSL